MNYRWRKEGDVTPIPRAMYGTLSNGAVSNYNTLVSDRFVEDGSFLRLNSATLGYTLPQEWTKKAGLSKVRFYVAGSNLFTITGYTGYDPEVDIATGLTPNIDNNRYPRSRTYTFGAQLTF